MPTASASRRTRGPSSDPQARLPRRLGRFSPFVTGPTGGCGVTWFGWGEGGESRQRPRGGSGSRVIPRGEGRPFRSIGTRACRATRLPVTDEWTAILKKRRQGPLPLVFSKGPPAGSLSMPQAPPALGDRRPLPPRSPLSSVYLVHSLPRCGAAHAACRVTDKPYGRWPSERPGNSPISSHAAPASGGSRVEPVLSGQGPMRANVCEGPGQARSSEKNDCMPIPPCTVAYHRDGNTEDVERPITVAACRLGTTPSRRRILLHPQPRKEINFLSGLVGGWEQLPQDPSLIGDSSGILVATRAMLGHMCPAFCRAERR